MHSRIVALSVLFFFIQRAAAEPPAALQTVAEKTDFRDTSRHADVVGFCEELVKKSPVVRLSEIGQSGEKRKLPLLILADPPIAKPEEVANGRKLVIMAFANIHAGEVDGKEAVLMLARDIALADEKSILKNLVILIVPILNADGNEKISKNNRPEQNGPINGVGVRTNADGYDLNRDFVKLETPEVRALTKTITRWNPAVIVDMHTTNGSYHRYALTYDGPRHPNADASVISIVRDKWLPEIGTRMEKSTGYRSFFYGDFSQDHKSWVTYPALPRYGVQCFAMRNQIGILSESYTYAPFKDRVYAGRTFVRGILEYVAAHADEVRKLLVAARQPRDRIELRVKNVAVGGERTLLGFVEEMKDGHWVATKQTKDYSGRYLGGATSTLTVQRPYAYLLPAASAKVLKTLQGHGIVVEELRREFNLDVQVYKIEKWTRAKELFQKHNLSAVEVSRRDEPRKVAPGTVLIRTEQPLGALASYLLEPQAEDGLTAWNFYDEALADGKDIPVIRLPKSIPLDREAVRPLRED